MLKRFLSFIAIAGVGLGLVAGCDNTGEQQRSVVVVRQVNQGAPVIVDVLEQGDSLFQDDGITPITHDDFITQDWLVVEMQNVPYNPLVTTEPGLPHGDFVVTDYEIVWTRTDGGSEKLPTFRGNTSQVIPSGGDAVFAILLVTFDDKRLPVLNDLNYMSPVAAGDEIHMRADITFEGHEVGTERETEIKTTVSAAFVDLVVATSDKD
jgi:hypothetical protein